jgi:hypothetical protein
MKHGWRQRRSPDPRLEPKSPANGDGEQFSAMRGGTPTCELIAGAQAGGTKAPGSCDKTSNKGKDKAKEPSQSAQHAQHGTAYAQHGIAQRARQGASKTQAAGTVQHKAQRQRRSTNRQNQQAEGQRDKGKAKRNNVRGHTRKQAGPNKATTRPRHTTPQHGREQQEQAANPPPAKPKHMHLKALGSAPPGHCVNEASSARRPQRPPTTHTRRGRPTGKDRRAARPKTGPRPWAPRTPACR